ncbi:hypothetical protein SS50377_22535 [Spironucleus salmonicida]|uniref:Uncharacterized protein n=1 Tax=Spironucleus salmonicida TaxID=348837 RepID=V6LBV3_9EUKA|nr:hypothetical protein SS50377_22535 [Spironucleus salmonicida]|eukprot:EST41975.1 Hypothetical protein SS50377_18280 [Spironucleus salmonicida]
MSYLSKSCSLTLDTIQENESVQEESDKYFLENKFTLIAFQEDYSEQQKIIERHPSTPMPTFDKSKQIRPYSAVERRYHFIPPEDDFIAQLEALRAQKRNV